MLKDMTITAFLAEVDGVSPAPGGGSVSALVGALGCALARMYGHLSFGKKNYEAKGEEIRERFVLSFEQLQEIEAKLLRLVDEDTEIFHRFMQAMKLPKATEQEMALRSKTMELATKDAIESPMAMIELCFDGIKTLEDMVGFGNRNAISDIGVGISCFEAAARGAYLNVIINLPGLNDDELAYVYERKAKLKLDQIMRQSYDFFNVIRVSMLGDAR